MSDELLFLPNEINLSNISALQKKQTVLEERRICELAELAADAARSSVALMTDGEMSLIEVLSVVSEMGLESDPGVHDGVLKDNLNTLSSYVGMLGFTDRVIFSGLYKSKLLSLGVRIREESFLQTADAPSTFVYVKNAFADEAYDVFSQDFAEPRVLYADTFKDALRLVRDGEVTYCLLPLEERGSRLPTIAELLFADDLKIDAVTPVYGFDGAADMKYALVSKSFLVPRVALDDDRYLEIRTAADRDVSLAELLFAADKYGARLYRVNMHFFENEGVRHPYYSIIFKEDGRDFSDLLTYLTLFVSSYTAIGIYKNLEL